MPIPVASFRSLAVALSLAAISVPAATVASAQNPEDPFYKPVDKTKVQVAVPKETIVEPPTFDVRAAECRTRTGARSVADLPCAYLVKEVTFAGVSRSETGLEAFLTAAPTHQTIVVRKGDRLYDGVVTDVREADASSEASVLIQKSTQKYVGKKLVTTTALVTLAFTNDATLEP